MLVLARKYRPRRLADLVGQPVVVKTLTNALSKNRLHHAYLFAGNKGSGKTSSGRILAAAENCQSDGIEPCGTCSLCKGVFSGNHADISEIDAASNAGKVDQIRELKHVSTYNPIDGAKTKYFIIDECLPAESLVSMADGSKIPIGKLVEEGISGQRSDDTVCSRDVKTGEIIHQFVCRYIKIPNDKQMYEVKVKDPNGNTRVIKITGNHNIFVKNAGKVKVQDLQVGQKLFLQMSRVNRNGEE